MCDIWPARWNVSLELLGNIFVFITIHQLKLFPNLKNLGFDIKITFNSVLQKWRGDGNNLGIIHPLKHMLWPIVRTTLPKQF